MLTELLLSRPTLESLVPQQGVSRRLKGNSANSPVHSQNDLSGLSQPGTSSNAWILDLSTAVQAKLGTQIREPQGRSQESSKQDSEQENPVPVMGDSPANEELSEDEQRQVDQLENIDQKVHTHEQAHLAAAGGYARGGAHFDYATGPDGERYAVSGHVNLDTSRENTPEDTLRKAQTVRQAALAPADPSSSDHRIAADMSKMAQEARSQIQSAAMSENSSTSGTKGDSGEAAADPQNPQAPSDSQATGSFAGRVVAAYRTMTQGVSSAFSVWA